jgi:transcriptional regulator with XRE-family HTH domain
MPSSTYAQRVGERLRAIRLQKGLSLHDVEDASTKEFKASVLGAYERGERSISVPRLQRLAIFYGVPVDQLLRDARSPETDVLQRYLNMIQMARGDFNGKVLTVRTDDVKTLAAIFELTPEALTTRLDDLGVRIPALI